MNGLKLTGGTHSIFVTGDPGPPPLVLLLQELVVLFVTLPFLLQLSNKHKQPMQVASTPNFSRTIVTNMYTNRTVLAAALHPPLLVLTKQRDVRHADM